MNISRRKFLKGGVVAAGTIAATAVPKTLKASESNTDETLVTLIDISKCIGCEACVEGCKDVNSGKYPKPKKPFPKMYPNRVPVMDWSDKQDVNDRLTPYNWVYIQSADVEVAGEEKELFIPRRCMHCKNPPCVKLCPWGAARQQDNGISRFDPDLCMGGSKCKGVCPWKIPERQTGVGIYLDVMPALAGNGVMFKCDRCYNRIAKGEMPACIEECPNDVQKIGKASDIIKEAKEIAKKTGGYLYGLEENGGTNTIYISPVPFEELNSKIEKGKGKPHFKKVGDAMENGNNIALAMIVAPLAGIAAAFGKFYKGMKADGGSDE
ncbi:MAG: 4Fe-4S dicluster domain-containing protein [Desulfobacterales bacterium]|nr:4Fe-4S dicluster domain-containing protein [Desulfobacterales bacterium]MCP4161826.1 4Fe-4S dicluster domain-containing protein [Deltaproteobacteria bacterium]